MQQLNRKRRQWLSYGVLLLGHNLAPCEQHYNLPAADVCHVMSDRQQEKASWLYLLLALLGHSSHTV